MREVSLFMITVFTTSCALSANRPQNEAANRTTQVLAHLILEEPESSMRSLKSLVKHLQETEKFDWTRFSFCVALLMEATGRLEVYGGWHPPTFLLSAFKRFGNVKDIAVLHMLARSLKTSEVEFLEEAVAEILQRKGFRIPLNAPLLSKKCAELLSTILTMADLKTQIIAKLRAGFSYDQVVSLLADVRDGWGNHLYLDRMEDNNGLLLISYGADRQPGGEGLNEDITLVINPQPDKR